LTQGPIAGESQGKGTSAVSMHAQIHMVVRAEPDPRYVFQFDGKPEYGSVMYHVPGGAASGGQRRQPVFTPLRPCCAAWILVPCRDLEPRPTAVALSGQPPGRRHWKIQSRDGSGGDAALAWSPLRSPVARPHLGSSVSSVSVQRTLDHAAFPTSTQPSRVMREGASRCGEGTRTTRRNLLAGGIGARDGDLRRERPSDHGLERRHQANK